MEAFMKVVNKQLFPIWSGIVYLDNAMMTYFRANYFGLRYLIWSFSVTFCFRNFFHWNSTFMVGENFVHIPQFVVEITFALHRSRHCFQFVDTSKIDSWFVYHFFVFFFSLSLKILFVATGDESDARTRPQVRRWRRRRLHVNQTCWMQTIKAKHYYL